MMLRSKRLLYAAWLTLICCFAVLHALNLRADFPNSSPWYLDQAKYTDEGWWANAAIDAHLYGNWYPPLDYNPAPVVPVLPFLEWVLFFLTGVTIEAARGLAVTFFFANLVLSYLLLRGRGPRWMALLALTLLATSPFLYSFSRLAILEPAMITMTLAALNLAVRLPRLRFPILASMAIGLLITLMMLTKTAAVFLLPALGWAILLPLWTNRKRALQCLFTAAGSAAVFFGMWMTLVVSSGMLGEFRKFLSANRNSRPNGFYWLPHLLDAVIRMAWRVDRILIPLAVAVVLGAVWAWRSARGRKLLLDPVFGASILAIAGYILFMVVHSLVTQRYFAVIAVFSFLAITQGAGALLDQTAHGQESDSELSQNRPATPSLARFPLTRWLGWVVIALCAVSVSINGAWTIRYAVHPEYTFVDAAQALTQFIDHNPNGRRLLVSVSGDQIALVTHLPTLCAPEAAGCSTFQNPASSLALYQPGWYAGWNVIDRRTLEILHAHFSLEQVASFQAFDRPDRNVLVLFKLHPLPAGQVRDPATENLDAPLPGDKIDIPVE
jgi:hypothetical protein